ncbi:hypothetical protein CQY22_012780 [Mycolicibacterium brumae]|uniref:Uncharacterized protein n=2 Tax=Mycolicibacterium brumae TaxID=85968 RepID=A0A2G5P8F7_9MYCO|nr:hypothetical protein CQY22_012780 [Mycolicibacterium brumae]RWA18943.1 hypothetical protein MBRU_17615 [Mycolicibacterium brumae DSM 44177]
MSVLAALAGTFLFFGGLIYGYVALNHLAEHDSLRWECTVRTGTQTQDCELEASGSPRLLIEAKQGRVVLAAGLMVSGAVLLGAGILGGRQQFHYSAPTGYTPPAAGYPPASGFPPSGQSGGAPSYPPPDTRSPHE